MGVALRLAIIYCCSTTDRMQGSP